MGREGYFMVNEWFIYVLDFGLMVVVMVVFYFWYLGNFVVMGVEVLELYSRDGSVG